MSKRPYPWEEDYQRQYKTHVNDQRVRGNDATHMNDIYGARRAATQPPMPQDGLPGSSNQPLDLLNVSGVMDDVEMDDYESYEMPVAHGSAVGSGDAVEMKPLPDLVPGPSTSSPFSGNDFIEATIEDSPEESLCDIEPVCPRMSRIPRSGINFTQGTVGDTPEASSRDINIPWPRMSRIPCSGINFTEGTVGDTSEASSHDINISWPRMSRRHSRLDKLRNMEKRDPSPVPSTQNLLTSFINTTRRTHGPFSEAEKDTLLQQAKTYKQLNMDSFVRSRDMRGNSNENHMDRGKNQKDVNDNKEMEY